MSRCQEKGIAPPPSLKLPPGPPLASVEVLLGAVGAEGTSPETDEVDESSFDVLRAKLAALALDGVQPESLDADRMHAIALAIHIESMRPQ